MSGLKLGAHMSIAGGVSNALDAAADVHSNAVQVFMKSNRQWAGPQVKEEDVSRWNEQMPSSGVAYAVSHASYLINLASPKDPLWEKSIAAFADELERAHAYGIRHVVLHPGAHTGSGEEAGLQRIGDALNRVHAQLPECTGVSTLLELMAGQGTTLGYNFAQLASIIEPGGGKGARRRLSRHLPRTGRRLRFSHRGGLRGYDGGDRRDGWRRERRLLALQ